MVSVAPERVGEALTVGDADTVKEMDGVAVLEAREDVGELVVVNETEADEVTD